MERDFGENDCYGTPEFARLRSRVTGNRSAANLPARLTVDEKLPHASPVEACFMQESTDLRASGGFAGDRMDNLQHIIHQHIDQEENEQEKLVRQLQAKLEALRSENRALRLENRHIASILKL